VLLACSLSALIVVTSRQVTFEDCLTLIGCEGAIILPTLTDECNLRPRMKDEG